MTESTTTTKVAAPARCATTTSEQGMSTAEYAVGTVGATAFAGVLLMVFPPLQHELLGWIAEHSLSVFGAVL